MGLFSKDDNVPVAVSVGEDGEESKAEFYREFQTPEGYYEYKTELIIPEAFRVFKNITKDFQLGNLSKEEYEKAQFIYGFCILCLKYPKTRKAGNHFLKELEMMFVASNSKEGFLRKHEHTKTKESIIKQAKNWKERVKW